MCCLLNLFIGDVSAVVFTREDMGVAFVFGAGRLRGESLAVSPTTCGTSTGKGMSGCWVLVGHAWRRCNDISEIMKWDPYSKDQSMQHMQHSACFQLVIQMTRAYVQCMYIFISIYIYFGFVGGDC